MNRRDFLKSSILALGGASALSATGLRLESFPLNAQGQRVASGYVFHDRNGNGRRDANDPGVPNVAVSNGREVVKTDRNGRWELPVAPESVFFVIKPSNWAVPLNQYNLPQHYYVHRPEGSPERRYEGVTPTGPLPPSVDFALTPQREDRKFRMVMNGDPQPRNQAEIDYMAQDVTVQMKADAAKANAKFGISLGDIMFDNLEHYDSLNATFATIGIPWHNVLGNHDLNFDSVENDTANETFIRHYGTPYYAFNYGPVHFIVINDVVWRGGTENRGYHGEITANQLEFIKNDLHHVPRGNLVVLCFHIPLASVRNRQDLYRLIEDRPHTVSFSAHTHVCRHYFYGEEDGWRGREPHHHVNHGTVCGSWWSGAPDHRGIPHATMSDGGPNGYSIVEFDGPRYKISFRPASEPTDHQMSLWLPNEIHRSELAQKTLIANVFNGSERSTCRFRIDGGTWTAMEQFNGQDPYLLEIKKLEEGPNPPVGRRTPGVSNTNHLWKGTLPTLSRGTYLVEVETTDMHGQTYSGTRIVRVI